MWVAIVAALALLYHNYRVSSLKHQLVEAQLSTDSLVTLADSTRAMLASTELDKVALSDALSAERQLNGRLVAAARVRFQPGRVTRELVDGVQTVKDSTRTLAVLDSTEAGVLDATVEAPPYPAKLLFSYTFNPAPIDATISVVEVRDGSAVFAVKYRGGESTIEAPFARLPRREKVLAPYAEALYSFVAPTNAALRVGAQLKLPVIRGLYGIAEAQQMFGNADVGSVYVGVRKVF